MAGDNIQVSLAGLIENFRDYFIFAVNTCFLHDKSAHRSLLVGNRYFFSGAYGVQTVKHRTGAVTPYSRMAGNNRAALLARPRPRREPGNIFSALRHANGPIGGKADVFNLSINTNGGNAEPDRLAHPHQGGRARDLGWG